MNFNSNEAKNSAISAGAGIGGFLVAHKVGKMLEEKLPANVAKFSGLILAGAGVIAPALLNLKHDALKSALMGMTIAGGIVAANQFSKDETGAPATTGFRKILAENVPTLAGVELPAVYTYHEPARLNTAESLQLAANFGYAEQTNYGSALDV